MFRKSGDNSTKVDVKKVNEVLNVGSKILKLAFVLVILISIYSCTLLIKEWNIFDIILRIIRLISPLFIGFIVAWLFHPFVSWLQRKGVRRGLGTAIIYILFILFVYLVLGSLIPVLSEQMNEFAKSIPSVFDTIKTWINSIFDKLNRIDNFDAMSIKSEMFKKLEEFGTSLAQGIPEYIVSLVKILFSGIGNILIGLIIGFYLLVSFDNVNDSLITILPKGFRDDTRELFNEINTLLRRFVKGALIDCLIVFFLSSISLWLVGLKSPLLFGFFCAITNIIPYAGPYIGGAPAVIVGFSQGIGVGILSIVVLVVIQMIEGNLLQPIIMSRSTKIHPVTVMLALLVFGYFFGIVGMVLATPIVAVLKAIFNFFEVKYNWFDYNDKVEE